MSTWRLSGGYGQNKSDFFQSDRRPTGDMWANESLSRPMNNFGNSFNRPSQPSRPSLLGDFGNSRLGNFGSSRMNGFGPSSNDAGSFLSKSLSSSLSGLNRSSSFRPPMSSRMGMAQLFEKEMDDLKSQLRYGQFSNSGRNDELFSTIRRLESEKEDYLRRLSQTQKDNESLRGSLERANHSLSLVQDTAEQDTLQLEKMKVLLANQLTSEYSAPPLMEPNWSLKTIFTDKINEGEENFTDQQGRGVKDRISGLRTGTGVKGGSVLSRLGRGKGTSTGVRGRTGGRGGLIMTGRGGARGRVGARGKFVGTPRGAGTGLRGARGFQRVGRINRNVVETGQDAGYSVRNRLGGMGQMANVSNNVAQFEAEENWQ